MLGERDVFDDQLLLQPTRRQHRGIARCNCPVVPWHSVERPCPLMGKADDMALPDFAAKSQHVPLGALLLRLFIIRGPHPEHLTHPLL